MKDDHIRWIEQTETEIMNDKSERIKHDNIQNIVKETTSIAKNESTDSINEYVKDAIKNEYYELLEARNAVKYIEHFVKHIKYIIDRNSAKPKDYDKWTYKEQYEHIIDNLKTYVPSVPDSLLFLIPAMLHRGDCGRNSTDKPLWLDMEKFQRGQKFAQNHISSIFLANLLSLFEIFTFPNGLKPLIFSRQSHTPYLAFKRYLSTACRVKNWMTEDPWTVGTQAYNDIQTVRKMHRAIRLKLCEHDYEEIEAAIKIRNPWCLDRETILEDFSSLIVKNDLSYLLLPLIGLHQCDMACTQFAFMGMILLYPDKFGIYASDEDIAAFCHTWRGIGYLLGIEERNNFCRGSIKEIKQRSRDFVECWVKLNLKQVTPEWEHMMRCIIEGESYYASHLTFKMLLLFVTNLLNIDMPRIRSKLTYFEWFRLMFLRFSLRYTIKLPFIRKYFNNRIHKVLEKGIKYGPEDHKKLRERSQKSLDEGRICI